MNISPKLSKKINEFINREKPFDLESERFIHKHAEVIFDFCNEALEKNREFKTKQEWGCLRLLSMTRNYYCDNEYLNILENHVTNQKIDIRSYSVALLITRHLLYQQEQNTTFSKRLSKKNIQKIINKAISKGIKQDVVDLIQKNNFKYEYSNLNSHIDEK